MQSGPGRAGCPGQRGRVKVLAIMAAFLACAGTAYALRPSDQLQKSHAKAVWMTVSSPSTGNEYYLEASQDGHALLREENAKGIITRRGTVPVQLVKDFVRETENSEAMGARDKRESKAIFYKGEVAKVYAYISGELTLGEAPLNKFGEAFNYAFGELHKAALKLPEEKDLGALLKAEPLTGDELDAFRNKAAVDGEVPVIETFDLQKFKQLLAAIKDANRLIPLETQADVQELRAFIDEHHLYGLRTLFYLPSTRGTFKCYVLEAARQQAAITPKTDGKKTGKKILKKKRPVNKP